MRRFPASVIVSASLLGAASLITGVTSSTHTLATSHNGAPSGRLTSFEDQPHEISTGLLSPPTTAICQARWKISCYVPSQVEAAYNLGPLTAQNISGQGQTIVIVDPYGSPTISSDLASFDTAFNLPAPRLSIIAPAGKIPKFNSANADMVGWAGETTLDVEWAHVMAPSASILLVETPTDEIEGTSGFAAIVAAEKYVIANKLGTVISQSFGATEPTFSPLSGIASFRSAYVAAAQPSADVTVLAATGDSGATDVGPNGVTYYSHPVIDWPASDPLVTAVGGTELQLNATGGRVSADVAWNDTYNPLVTGTTPSPNASGGGRSAYFTGSLAPSYQASILGGRSPARETPDISMSAACSGSVDVYQSFPGTATGWYTVCGTSEATPLFAGIVALADQVAGHGLGPINTALYAMAATPALGAQNGITDVTSGNNSVTFTSGSTRTSVTGYQAGPGYDMVTGLGTVNAALFVPALAKAAS